MLLQLVIARSEATEQSIYPLGLAGMDSFASLAMTLIERRVSYPHKKKTPVGSGRFR